VKHCCKTANEDKPDILRHKNPTDSFGIKHV